MDFLDSVYFGNTVRSYLAIVGVILFIILFKRYFSRFIASLCFRRVKKVWKTVDRQTFLDLVVGPMDTFFVVVISVFALDKLYFPEELKFNIYGHSFQDILDRIGTAAIVLCFTWLVLRMVAAKGVTGQQAVGDRWCGHGGTLLELDCKKPEQPPP